ASTLLRRTDVGGLGLFPGPGAPSESGPATLQLQHTGERRSPYVACGLFGIGERLCRPVAEGATAGALLLGWLFVWRCCGVRDGPPAAERWRRSRSFRPVRHALPRSGRPPGVVPAIQDLVPHQEDSPTRSAWRAALRP